MTTATQTLRNVASLLPVIDIRRSMGAVLVMDTATQFVNDNLRHLVNRRMRWSSCETFVRAALRLLAATVNRVATSAEIEAAIEDAVDCVRDAANRRRSWTAVEQSITHTVERVIRGALNL